MKLPGPDHPITIVPEPRRVRVAWRGTTIVDTRAALRLQETSYPPVLYVPRADVAMDLLARTTRSTHCPYKGDASYYSIHVDGSESVDAAWSYEDPYPSMAAIRGCLAFYPDRVDGIAITPD